MKDQRKADTGSERSGKMKRGKYMTEWLLAGGLAIAVAFPFPGLAQKGGFHAPPQQHHPTLASQPPHPAQAHPAQPPRQQPGRLQSGHAGDWLRRYKDLSPAEQERALQKDPGFRSLPPAQQQLLRQRLQHFSSLPPQQQLRMLNRMETWEHLTPAQKNQARQIFNQMRQLPPARQHMVGTAIHDLRNMPADQRERVIDSPRFKGMFSDHEREMIRGATRLPLAPPESGENGP